MPPPPSNRMTRGLLSAFGDSGDISSALPSRGLLSLDEKTQGLLGFDPSIVKRGSVLPLGMDVQGNTSLAWPQFAYDLARSFMLPGHVAEGGGFSQGDVTDMALNFGLLGGAAGAATTPRGALAMGAGRLGDDSLRVLDMSSGASDIVRLYHGTSGENANGILKEGPRGALFLAPRKAVAKDYAENVAGDAAEVIAVDVPRSKLRIDLDLPGAKLLTVKDANGYLGNEGWTIDDYINAGYSVGIN